MVAGVAEVGSYAPSVKTKKVLQCEVDNRTGFDRVSSSIRKVTALTNGSVFAIIFAFILACLEMTRTAAFSSRPNTYELNHTKRPCNFSRALTSTLSALTIS